MISGGDIRGAALDAIAAAGTPRRSSLACLLERRSIDPVAALGTVERWFARAPFPDHGEAVLWAVLGLLVGERLAAGLANPGRVLTTADLATAIDDDSALGEEHERRTGVAWLAGWLHAAGIEPFTTTREVTALAVELDAAYPAAATTAFLRGVRIGLRLVRLQGAAA